MHSTTFIPRREQQPVVTMLVAVEHAVRILGERRQFQSSYSTAVRVATSHGSANVVSPVHLQTTLGYLLPCANTSRSDELSM